MTFVFVSAGATSTVTATDPLPFGYAALSSKPATTTSTSAVDTLVADSQPSGAVSRLGMDGLTGQLHRLALMDVPQQSTPSAAAVPHWPIAPCRGRLQDCHRRRRLRRHHSISQTTLEVDNTMPTLATHNNSHHCGQRRRYQHHTATPSLDNDRLMVPITTITAVADLSLVQEQREEQEVVVETLPLRGNKRRLSLDIAVPPSVLKRRCAISTLLMPSTLALVIERAEASRNNMEQHCLSDGALTSPGLSSSASSAGSPVTSDDEEEEEEDEAPLL